MLQFKIQDMTCGHCAGKITKAVKAVEESATVNVDLKNKLVEIDAGDARAVEAAIREAGFSPVLKA